MEKKRQLMHAAIAIRNYLHMQPETDTLLLKMSGYIGK